MGGDLARRKIMRPKATAFGRMLFLVIIICVITFGMKFYGSVERAVEKKHQESGLAYAGKWQTFGHMMFTAARKQLLEKGYSPNDIMLSTLNYGHSVLCKATINEIPEKDIERVFFWRLCVLVPAVSQGDNLASIKDELMQQIKILGEAGSVSVYLDKVERYTMQRSLIAIYVKRRKTFFPNRENRINADINVLSAILKMTYSADAKYILERYGNKTSFFEFLDQSQNLVLALFLSGDYSDACPEDLFLAWNTIDNYLENFIPIARQIDAYYPQVVKSALNKIETNRTEAPQMLLRNYPACTSKFVER